jgi:hypothetical protein
MSDGTARATRADRRPDKTKLTFWKSFLRHFSLTHGRPGGVNRRAIIAPRPGAAPKRRSRTALKLIAADFPLAK